MEENSIKVNSIYEKFRCNYINKDDNNKNRFIKFPGFTRLGMELNGIFLNEKILTVVCWGKRESKFLERFTKEQQKDIISKVLKSDPPLFILSKSFEYTDMLVNLNKEINKNNSAIIQVEYSTVEIYSLIGTWISKNLSKWTTIHGTVLSIWGEGVLIIGKPGIGKSEAASELIRMNHLFLADDAVNIARLGTFIWAKSHPLSKEFMNIRGLGMLNVREMYGIARIIEEARISIVIELKHWDSFNKEFEIENIGDHFRYYNLLGVDLPFYTLPVTSGRNVSELIELAVIDMKLKTSGYNSAQVMDDKYKNFFINKNKKFS